MICQWTRLACSWAGVAAFVILAYPPGHAQSTAARSDIRGAWHAELYTLKTGERHPVKGSVVFTATDWSLTFFITANGQPQRANAEGGTYTLDGTKLVFKYLYVFISAGGALAGLPERPMQMTIYQDSQTSPLERVLGAAVDGEQLTLTTQAGNTMTFRRSSRF